MIRLHRALDEETFRRAAGELANDLKEEGLRAHRAADRLEGRSRIGPFAVAAPRGADHGRSRVHDRLSAHRAEGPLQIVTAYLAAYLDRLVEIESNAPEELRQQAAAILDAAETLASELDTFDARLTDLKNARRRQREDRTDKQVPGPLPSVGTDTIVQIMIDYKITATRMSARLAKADIAITANTLAKALSRHLEGRGSAPS
jgi:hypothetical protein